MYINTSIYIYTDTRMPYLYIQYVRISVQHMHFRLFFPHIAPHMSCSYWKVTYTPEVWHGTWKWWFPKGFHGLMGAVTSRCVAIWLHFWLSVLPLLATGRFSWSFMVVWLWILTDVLSGYWTKIRWTPRNHGESNQNGSDIKQSWLDSYVNTRDMYSVSHRFHCCPFPNWGIRLMERQLPRLLQICWPLVDISWCWLAILRTWTGRNHESTGGVFSHFCNEYCKSLMGELFRFAVCMSDSCKRWIQLKILRSLRMSLLPIREWLWWMVGVGFLWH